MRASDRDLIRGGHYGQRPSVPHSKAEHMAAPTKAANVKKVLRLRQGNVGYWGSQLGLISASVVTPYATPRLIRTMAVWGIWLVTS